MQYEFKNGYAIVQSYCNLMGMIDQNGKEIIPTLYEGVSDTFYGFADDLVAVVQVENKYGLVNNKGKKITPIKYDAIPEINYVYAPVKVGNKWGYVDIRNGKELTPIKYEEVRPGFINGFAYAKMHGKFGVINSYGKEITPFKYSQVEDFINISTSTSTSLNEMYALVSYCPRDTTKCKQGLIDESGKEVIKPQFDEISTRNAFCRDATPVRIGDSWGIINQSGEMIIPTNYSKIECWYSLFKADKDGKRIYFTKTGKQLGDFEDVYSNTNCKNLVGVKQRGKWGVINMDGKQISTANNDYTRCLHDKYFGISQNHKWGIIDEAGNQITAIKYDDISPYSDGNFGVKIGNKWGFIESTGKEIVSPKYDKVEPFQKGFAWVQLNGKWGFINKDGKEITAQKFDYVQGDNKTYFINDLAGVAVNGQWGYVNQRGEEVIPLSYDDITSFQNGIAAVQKQSKIGFINPKGEKITSLKYDAVESFYNGSTKVYLEGKEGEIDIKGKESWSGKQSELKKISLSDFSTFTYTINTISDGNVKELAKIKAGNNFIIHPNDKGTIYYTNENNDIAQYDLSSNKEYIFYKWSLPSELSIRLSGDGNYLFASTLINDSFFWLPKQDTYYLKRINIVTKDVETILNTQDFHYGYARLKFLFQSGDSYIFNKSHFESYASTLKRYQNGRFTDLMSIFSGCEPGPNYIGHTQDETTLILVEAKQRPGLKCSFPGGGSIVDYSEIYLYRLSSGDRETIYNLSEFNPIKQWILFDKLSQQLGIVTSKEIITIDIKTKRIASRIALPAIYNSENIELMLVNKFLYLLEGSKNVLYAFDTSNGKMQTNNLAGYKSYSMLLDNDLIGMYKGKPLIVLKVAD